MMDIGKDNEDRIVIGDKSSNDMPVAGAESSGRRVSAATTPHAAGSKSKQAIRELRANDVLLGRGPGLSSFVGNVRFRAIASERKDAYISATLRKEKTRIAKQVIAEVHAKGGRFLKQGTTLDDKDLWYEEASQDVALEKAKQSLREKQGNEGTKSGRASRNERSTDRTALSPFAVKLPQNVVLAGDRARKRYAESESPLNKPFTARENVSSQQQLLPQSLPFDDQVSPVVPTAIMPQLFSSGGSPYVDPRLLLFQRSSFASAARAASVLPPVPFAKPSSMNREQSFRTIQAKSRRETLSESDSGGKRVQRDANMSETASESDIGGESLFRQDSLQSSDPMAIGGRFSTNSARKSAIVNSHMRCSEDDEIERLINDLDMNHPLRRENVDSDVPVAPLQQKETESMALKTEDVETRMNPCAASEEDAVDVDVDVGAFLLASLSITGRPGITTEEEAKERASLSIEERAAIVSDALGIYPAHRNKKARRMVDRESTAFLISLMKREIDEIPIDERGALVEAQATCGIQEFSDKRLELFLLTEGMNAKLAARRFVRYWESRKQVFGDKYMLPMTLAGALRDDVVALQTGVYRLLPKPDAFGRPLLVLDVARHSLNGYTSESMLRAIWFIHEVAAEKAQGAGIVQVVWFKGCSIFDYDLRVYDKLAYLKSWCFPAKDLASHLCCLPASIARIVKPIIHSFMSKEFRARTFTHNVPESEVGDVLSDFGITKEVLPREIAGGLLVLDQNEWIASRRAKEMEEL